MIETFEASRLVALTLPSVENVKEVAAFSSTLRLIMVRLEKAFMTGIPFLIHLETAQSEAKASPRKPKVESLLRSEN